MVKVQPRDKLWSLTKDVPCTFLAKFTSDVLSRMHFAIRSGIFSDEKFSVIQATVTYEKDDDCIFLSSLKIYEYILLVYCLPYVLTTMRVIFSSHQQIM